MLGEDLAGSNLDGMTDYCCFIEFSSLFFSFNPAVTALSCKLIAPKGSQLA